ncbi:hypothetical protein BHM03_00047798 [Ensete ventricosum]|nr:hypothetical protein BHM03_00047798 [Ensete ventricosum]
MAAIGEEDIRLREDGYKISPSLFHGSVRPTTVPLPSTSLAHGSVAAASAAASVDFCTAFPLHMPRSSSSANRAIAFLNLCPTSLPPLLCRWLLGSLLHPLSRAPLLPPCWTRSNIRSTLISPASFDPFSCCFPPTPQPPLLSLSNHALLCYCSCFYPAAAASSCCLDRSICYLLEVVVYLAPTTTARR